jgi:hypothetical protein
MMYTHVMRGGIVVEEVLMRWILMIVASRGGDARGYEECVRACWSWEMREKAYGLGWASNRMRSAMTDSFVGSDSRW